MFEFENLWMALLLPTPLLVYFAVGAQRTSDAALRVPFLQSLQSLQQAATYKKKSNVRQLIRNAAAILGLAITWLLLVASLCRPVIVGEAIVLPTEARDLMLALDISGSMEETDMQLNGRSARRIDAVKQVLADFTQRRSGDRMGLILFADQAYLQVPLTHDTATVAQLLGEAQLGFAGQKTAIGDAIGLSVKRLMERPAESRVLILLTDGANNAGSVSPRDAAGFAAENAITIHTVGVGAEVVVERSLFGTHRRNPSRDLDERTRQSIAAQTGGQYFRARNSEELESIYTELDRLEPVEQDDEVVRPRHQLFHWPLGLALGLFMLQLALHSLKPLAFGVGAKERTAE